MMSAILNYFASEIWEDDTTLALSRILLRYDECNLRPFDVGLPSRRSYEKIGGCKQSTQAIFFIIFDVSRDPKVSLYVNNIK